MAKTTFPYKQEYVRPNAAFPNGAEASRPIVNATITASNGNTYEYEVLPDSGADSCMFPMTLAKLLKLDPETMPMTQTGGIGGQSATFYDTLTIDMGNDIVFTIYACFSAGIDRFGLGILGQSGFFENFNVEFRHREKIFTVERS